MEHIEEAGIHSGDSACALPPITLGSADLLKIRAATEKLAARIGVRGLMNVQYAIKDDILYVHRGQPPGQPHGAVRLQGDGGAAGQGRRPDRGGGDHRRPARRRRAAGDRRRHRPARGRADRGQGGGAALPPVPHRRGPRRRHRALAGDEVHRRGHGPRRRVRHRVRQVAGRRLRLAAHRGHRLRLAGQPGQARRRSSRSSGWPTSASACWPPPAPRRCCAATAWPPRSSASSARARATCVERILAGDVDIVVNTPFGSPGNSGPRLDGYEIRTAAVAAGIPCITTVQGMAAAVQGIEALRRGDIGVRSLQEVHAALAVAPRGTPRERLLTAPAPRAAHPPVQRVVEVVGRPAGRRLRRADAWPPRRSPSGPQPGPVRRLRRRRADLRRCCCAARSRSPAPADGVVTVVVAAARARARPGWPSCSAGDTVDVVGPLGRPFPLPPRRRAGAAGRRRLRRRGAGRAGRAAAGAGSRGRPPSPVPRPPTGCARSRSSARLADAVEVTTDDGSAGRRGLGHRSPSPSCVGRAGVVYACGPMRMLRAVADAGHRRRASRPTSRSRSRWPAASGSA